MKELDDKISKTCLWFYVDCKKAMPQKHQYCNGIPKENETCFAYLSAEMLDEREKARKLEQAVKGDYQI